MTGVKGASVLGDGARQTPPVISWLVAGHVAFDEAYVRMYYICKASRMKTSVSDIPLSSLAG